MVLIDLDDSDLKTHVADAVANATAAVHQTVVEAAHGTALLQLPFPNFSLLSGFPSLLSHRLRDVVTTGDISEVGLLTYCLIVVVCILGILVTCKKSTKPGLKQHLIAYLTASAVAWGFGALTHRLLLLGHQHGEKAWVGERNADWVMIWWISRVSACFASSFLLTMICRALSYADTFVYLSVLVGFAFTCFEIFGPSTGDPEYSGWESSAWNVGALVIAAILLARARVKDDSRIILVMLFGAVLQLAGILWLIYKVPFKHDYLDQDGLYHAFVAVSIICLSAASFIKDETRPTGSQHAA